MGQVIDSSILIAATALAHDHGVIRRDERSFRRIPGLAVTRW